MYIFTIPCHTNTIVNLTLHYSVDEQECPFTVAENELFEKRYTEGYDLTIDHRYNKWLQAHHPDATFLALPPQVSKGMYIIIIIYTLCLSHSCI